ncbi:hypothetical protein A6A08_04605 [Nocardiopsis sp. TSRI0078]|uniref:hypothetical protein n=1 Tax=unclassified Nocardiopsis TaxID=2649073 RepID=UPI00093D83B9|nr:hypothetical protein [Nocardiopsis sp. TSRI0078]OKI18899.1 hypothetical protein A6A08_04605 [Nocardiopsis sp. TSRI0078]
MCTLVVAAAGLALVQRLSPPGSGPATAASAPGKATEPEQPADAAPTEPSHAPVEYSDFSDDGVVMRYPREWATVYVIVDATAEDSGVLSNYEFCSPSGDHRISFTVFSLEGLRPRTAREYQRDAETVFLMEEPNVSDWRRLALEDDPSAPSGWDASRMEATYRGGDWARPDRWMLWRYALATEEGRGYHLRFDVPASEQEEYAPVVEEVFDSFELVL